jgi:prepilin peptidase CpaA
MLLPLYLLRATGAGDVKFLAALGPLLGPHYALVAGLYTLIAGGALALGYMLIGMLQAALLPAGAPWPVRLHSAYARAHQLRRERFPYALAIVVGALAAITQRGDLQAVADYVSGAGR